MQYRYNAFGGLFTGVTVPYNALTLTGKRYDIRTGLIDFLSRWGIPRPCTNCGPTAAQAP